MDAGTIAVVIGVVVVLILLGAVGWLIRGAGRSPESPDELVDVRDDAPVDEPGPLPHQWADEARRRAEGEDPAERRNADDAAEAELTLRAKEERLENEAEEQDESARRLSEPGQPWNEFAPEEPTGLTDPDRTRHGPDH